MYGGLSVPLYGRGSRVRVSLYNARTMPVSLRSRG